jgi:hypothetical protein
MPGGIGLVHDDRHLVPLGSQIGGGGDVAAEADEHVGPHPVEDGASGVHRAGQPSRHREQPGRNRPGQRDRRDQLKRVAAHRHQPGFQAALGAQAGHLDAAVGLTQRVGERQSRLDMTG